MLKDKTRYLAGAGALVAAVAAWLWWQGAPVEANTLRLEAAEFAITLRAEGELKALRSVTISAPKVQGRMQIIQIMPAGRQVNPGDVLVRFDPTDKEKTRDDAQFDIRAAEEEIIQNRASLDAELSQMATEVKRAEIAAATAKLDLTKNEMLARVEAEKNELLLEQAEFTLVQLQRRIEAKKRQAASQLEKLEVNLSKAVAARKAAERDLQRMTLTAPISGLVVYKRMWKGGEMGDPEEGDTVWPGFALMELPDLTELKVIAYVHESDGGQLQEGQQVRIRMDAFPDNVFEGELKQISTLARPRRGQRGNPAKYFTITLSLDTTDPTMRPGMTTSVDVIVNTVAEALAIPLEAIFESGGEPAVYVKSGRGFELRTVKLGLRNATHVVIDSGVDAGDEVALRDPYDDTPDRFDGGQSDAS